jgi:ABC-type glycerol-3-phosphate transport system substrate-binding protein
LAQAGINETTAFKTADALVDTLEQLQANGVETPWTMPTTDLDVIYNAAPWVWAAGGRFRTRDGRHFRLHEPEAQAGLNAYFGVHRFLAPPAQGLDILGTDALFQEGKVTATISGPWLLRNLEQDNAFVSEVGVARVPGIPFVGGSHLVVWRHARDDQAIIRLMRYLASPDIQRLFFQQTGNLPSRVEVLNDEPFVSDPRYQVFAQSLKIGRVLTVSYRWAAVEQRLMSLLRRMWADLADDPQLDLKAELSERTKTLIEELERTVLGAWQYT